MKKTLSTLTFLALAATAAAHTGSMPHHHLDEGVNKTAIAAAVAIVAIGVAVFAIVRKRAKQGH